jgi:hypothetical protein
MWNLLYKQIFLIAALLQKKLLLFFLKFFMEIFAQISNLVYKGEKLLIILQKKLALLQ